MEKEVAAAQRLIAIPTTNPEEAGTGIGTVGSRIEGVPAIDESEGLFIERQEIMCGGWERGSPSILFQELGKDEGETGSGVKGREFGKASGGEGGKVGQGRNRSRGKVALPVGFREFLFQLLQQSREDGVRAFIRCISARHNVLMNSIQGEEDDK